MWWPSRKVKICSCSLLYKCVCVVCQTIMQFEPNNEFNSVLFRLSSLSNCSFCCSFLSSSFFLWFLLNGIFTTTILLFTPARACNSFQVCVGRMFSHMIFHFTKVWNSSAWYGNYNKRLQGWSFNWEPSPTLSTYLGRHWCHSCDKMDQAFPLRFCILGNKNNKRWEGLGMRLVFIYLAWEWG